MTAVPNWQPGTLYQPGSLVVPSASTALTDGTLTNGNFEDGDTGWIHQLDAAHQWRIGSGSPFSPFQGTYCANFGQNISTNGEYKLVNTKVVACKPGTVITLKAMIANATRPVDAGAAVAVFFWDASSPGGYGSPGAVQVGYQSGPSINGSTSYQLSTYTAVAPAGAAYAQFAVNAYANSYPADIQCDVCSWDYAGITVPTGLVFQAVQTDAATSGTTEPTWPTTLGDTVTDGGVTWEAVQDTQVTWTASPILVSGDTEPTWSTDIGGTVADNTIGWTAISSQITDSKCPNTDVVAIAASKIFAGDNDIIPFSATVNPLDWSTANDAGYLPFGLQTYGAEPVSAIGLYRSNLVAFNASAFQMWQVDQDPANMALLDAVPVGCVYPRTCQPLANDLIFLSSVGFRNVGIAGASTNLQTNGVGQPIDALIKPYLRDPNTDPLSLVYPENGQYWGIFGAEVFVLTINGANNQSWSRYTFPSEITDWTILDGDLILRSGTNVWRVSYDTYWDDVQPGSRTLGAVETGGLVVGYGTIGSTFGTLDDTSIGSDTIVALDQETAGNSIPYLLQLIVSSSSAPLAQNFFTQLRIVNNTTGEITCLNSADASLLPGNPNTAWQWTLDRMIFADGVNYSIGFDNENSIDIVGTVWWPHLDCGPMGVDKQLVGFDLISNAPTGVTVSIGYDQRDLNARTADYTIDADTLPGPVIPFPLTAPSFDVKLTFAAGQAWEHIAANLYLK